MVSISNRFITWDLSTSDMTRDVNPGVEGIMQNLVLSPDNRYAAAFTTNNQVFRDRSAQINPLLSYEIIFPSYKIILKLLNIGERYFKGISIFITERRVEYPDQRVRHHR